jgi:uncharacterized membrane protein
LLIPVVVATALAVLLAVEVGLWTMFFAVALGALFVLLGRRHARRAWERDEARRSARSVERR